MEQTFDLKKIKLMKHIILMLLGLFMIAAPFAIATDARRMDVDTFVLDDHWDIQINEEEYKDVKIDEFHFPVTQKGDVVTISTTIPSECQIMNPFLCIFTVHTTIQAYLDGKEFYEYGMEAMENNRLVGYGRSRFSLPQNHSGKNLTIVLRVTEDDAFEGIQELEIVDGSGFFKKEFAEGRLGFFISIFLISFGLLAMLLSMFSIHNNQKMTQVYCVAMFACLIGIWTLCNAGLMELMIPRLDIKALFEYTCLYAAPIPLTYYFCDRVRDEECPKWLKIYYWALYSAEWVFFASSVILQITNVVHMPKMLILSHILFAIAIVFIMLLAVFYIRKRRKVRKGIAIGLSFAALTIIIELVMFNLRKYITGFSGNKYSGTLCVVALIIVIALFVDFMERMSVALYEAAQKKFIENLAYSDEITGLANRRKMDEVLLTNKEESIPFAIVSLDMNYLKRINDTYGHDKGDKAIQHFAETLKLVFDENDVIGRIGGDEFVVITSVMNRDIINRKLEVFAEKLAETPLPGTGIRLTGAAGYAFSYECGPGEDSFAPYRKADERMYDRKRSMKTGL